MSHYPGATWRPLPSTSYYPGRRTAQLGLILHVQQGNASPFGWFANPVSKASSTFWVSKAGLVEQYMEAGSDASWAQAAGNFAYDSVETEGLDSEPLTGAQIAALAALCAWEHATFGMPLVTIETPGASGFGWHGMGGVAWGNHPGCPGDLRRAQRAQILGIATISNVTTTGGAIPTAPGDLTATPLTEGFLMALSDQQQTDVYNAIGRLDAALGAQGVTTGKIDTILQDVTDIRGGVAGLPALLAAQDPAAIAAAIPATVAQAVADELAKRLAG